jgi:hypothetical protein
MVSRSGVLACPDIDFKDERKTLIHVLFAGTPSGSTSPALSTNNLVPPPKTPPLFNRTPFLIPSIGVKGDLTG